jgi:hypothetical protein
VKIDYRPGHENAMTTKMQSVLRHLD